MCGNQHWTASEYVPAMFAKCMECHRKCKVAGLTDLIIDHGLGSLAINETWIMENKPHTIKFILAPAGFTINHVPF